MLVPVARVQIGIDTPKLNRYVTLYMHRADSLFVRRRGRPAVSAEHKRCTNAERQRRFRARRAAEWEELRLVAGRFRPPPVDSQPDAPDITLDLRELP